MFLGWVPPCVRENYLKPFGRLSLSCISLHFKYLGLPQSIKETGGTGNVQATQRNDENTIKLTESSLYKYMKEISNTGQFFSFYFI